MTFAEQGDGGAGGAHRGLMEGLWGVGGGPRGPRAQNRGGPCAGLAGRGSAASPRAGGRERGRRVAARPTASPGACWENRQLTSLSSPRRKPERAPESGPGTPGRVRREGRGSGRSPLRRPPSLTRGRHRSSSRCPVLPARDRQQG